MSIKLQNVTYRHHSIKSMKSADEWQACARRGGKLIGEVATALTQELAILDVKHQLNEAAAKQRAMRGADGFPTVDEVRAALPHLKPTKAQAAMLAAHFHAPDSILTATQLAQSAGYNDYGIANLHYGTLGRALAEELDWEPTEKTAGKTTWTFTLATGADGAAREKDLEISGHWRWKLRPEIVAALASR